MKLEVTVRQKFGNLPVHAGMNKITISRIQAHRAKSLLRLGLIEKFKC